MLGASGMLLLCVMALDKGTASHALSKGMLEALKVNYLVAGLIV
jgi:hypothetical protein